MVSSEIIEIILKAQDQASDTASKVNDQLKKLGDVGQQSNQKIAQASQMTQQKMQQLTNRINSVSTSTASATSKGASQFQRYNSSVQDSIIKFNTLDKETQEWLNRLANAHNPQVFYELNSGCQQAVAKFQQLDSLTDTWAGSMDYAKSKVQLMGTSTDTLKGKVQTVGTAIQTYVGNKWDSIKGKVSSFGNYIKTQLGNALQSVRSKLDSLGGAFSGLGGVISSAIGAIGMNSIKDMTVGLAMNRERMTALTSATMGGADAGQKFVNTMDELTNNSLVSLDNLGQAMSTIKMSTGMSNAELEKFTTTVNDVGQRAILMGYDGDQAMSLMQAAGRGLNGEFDMLKSNFGITKDQLTSLGWSGAADDVEGYQKALDKALEAGGNMDGMMDTTTGHLETLKKNFRVAGRHVGEMFTPYIDQAVQYLNSLKESCPGLFENLVMVAGGISMFATLAPAITPVLTALDQIGSITKGALVFVGLLEAEEGALTASGVAASASQTMLSIAEAAGADAAVLETAANAGLTASFWAMAAAILANPLTWVVVALLAIAVAVYEVGKAFGWWSDVGSMFEAIQNNVGRLWDAFINHPDVQAMISAISSALSTLWGYIQQAGQAIMEFFGVSTGGEWDVTRSIIDAIGIVWQGLTAHIRLAIQIIQAVVGAFQWLYSSAVSLGGYLSDVLSPAFSFLSALWGTLVEAVQPIVTVFQQFQDGQVGLVDVITTVASSLWNVWTILSSNLSNLILTLVGNLLTWAIQGGLNFLTGLLTYLSQLPGRVAIFLGQVLSRIISYGARWVAMARVKANLLLLGVVSYLRQLPGRALSALLGVVTAIVSAGAQWVSNARSKASQVVSNVVSTLSGLPGKISSAISGVVDAITKPFRDAYNTLTGIVDNIKSKAAEVGNISLPFGGDLPMGGDLEPVSANSSVVYNANGNTIGSSESLTVDINQNVTLDLVNVPSHISTDSLISALSNRDVLRALVENRDFQSIDAQVKERINYKVNRSRGI